MGNETELAIVFADVVGSMKLYEQLGDLKAREMVGICIDTMRQATEQQDGTVIKTMGDEVMSTFPSADDALNAAAQMQKQISANPALKVNEHAVAIRIGCNFGPVVIENRDIFGSAVHTANRMTSQAKAGQIMTTSTMVEHLSPDWRACVRQIDIATVKGRSSELALFEVLWQTEDITSMVPAIAMASRHKTADKPHRLRLRYQGQEVIVDERRNNISMGRAEENDLVVKGNLISRLHARIEVSRNKFMLIDQSTNGTFVLAKGGEEAFVRRDSMQIRSEGLIGLGKAPDSNSSQVIRYVCEE
ncbi:MAG: adenylate/guanylate cyclase domain-containing protein [Proteobacteria bacterium]|nr:adenylate/guanylate cyclase domain-containing protein [Pseudomonadota bacterium]